MIHEAIILLGILGGFFGIVIGIASKKLEVMGNEMIDKIVGVLPGINCGACGFAGCEAFASAIFEGKAPLDGCKVDRIDVAKAVAKILNRDPPVAGSEEVIVAVLYCEGGYAERTKLATYHGLKNCKAALTLSNILSCQYGCLGFGDCATACKFGAITISENGLPIVNRDKCTACNACVKACPRNLFRLVSKGKKVHITCSSHYVAKDTMKNCTVGCIGCGIRVRTCPEKAISLNENLALIDYGKCTNCGKCVTVCPRKIIRTVDQ